MEIITQKFHKIAKKIVFSLKNKEIKSIIGRDRLKFTYKEINDYVQIIFAHSVQQKTFKYFYKKTKLKITYQGFMKNILLFAKLFKFLFHEINKFLSINPSKLLNMVDTTLIEEKKFNFIHQKDWDSGRVTTRTNKKSKDKMYTCGSKGLIFINRFGQIYSANLLNINHSDQNILKDFTFYLKELKGILLADRGFSNKSIRERLKSFKTNVFIANQSLCRLISPYQYKQNIQLTEKERKLYKRRWKIETLFQNLKYQYSENKLNLSGKYKKQLKGAKFYSTLIQYNFSTI